MKNQRATETADNNLVSSGHPTPPASAVSSAKFNRNVKFAAEIISDKKSELPNNHHRQPSQIPKSLEVLEKHESKNSSYPVDVPPEGSKPSSANGMEIVPNAPAASMSTKSKQANSFKRRANTKNPTRVKSREKPVSSDAPIESLTTSNRKSGTISRERKPSLSNFVYPGDVNEDISQDIPIVSWGGTFLASYLNQSENIEVNKQIAEVTQENVYQRKDKLSDEKTTLPDLISKINLQMEKMGGDVISKQLQPDESASSELHSEISSLKELLRKHVKSTFNDHTSNNIFPGNIQT
jgi:hypothetical protein